MKLKTLQQPGCLEALVDSLVAAQDWMPSEADIVAEAGALTSALQKLARRASASEGAWRAWTNRHGIRFFVAEMSMELSRERGSPALKVRHYDEQGELQQYGQWIQLICGTWHPCAI